MNSAPHQGLPPSVREFVTRAARELGLVLQVAADYKAAMAERLVDTAGRMPK